MVAFSAGSGHHLGPSDPEVRAAGGPNPVAEKPPAGPGCAPTIVAHSETVLRRVYDIHLDAGTGPLVNPFPLDLSRRSGRAHEHYDPMDGRRPNADDWFNELFAALPPPRPGPGRALDPHRSTRVGADRSGSGTSIPASS